MTKRQLLCVLFCHVNVFNIIKLSFLCIDQFGSWIEMAEECFKYHKNLRFIILSKVLQIHIIRAIGIYSVPSAVSSPGFGY